MIKNTFLRICTLPWFIQLMWLTRESWCKIAHKWKFALRRSMNIDKPCCTLNSVVPMQTLSGYLFREWLLRVYIAPYHSIPCCICYEEMASIVGRQVRHIRWTMTYYISHEDTLTPAATPLTFNGPRILFQQMTSSWVLWPRAKIPLFCIFKCISLKLMFIPGM